MTSKRSLGLVGAGKVGTVLAAAFARSGYAPVAIRDTSSAAIAASVRLLGPIPAVSSAAAVVDSALLVLIAVPDDSLGQLVAGLASEGAEWRDRVVVHTSGRYGSDILGPLAALGATTIAIHPAMAFAGDAETELSRIPGTRFAVTASSGSAQELGASLVCDIAGVAVHIAEEDRGLYHAALAHGSNHLVTLVIQAAEMLQACGVESPASVLRPLLEAALDNALKRGPAGATGPVVRGDAGTLLEHVATLSRRLPNSLPAYRSLTLAGIAIARSAGRITAAQSQQLADATRPWESVELP